MVVTSNGQVFGGLFASKLRTIDNSVEVRGMTIFGIFLMQTSSGSKMFLCLQGKKKTGLGHQWVIGKETDDGGIVGQTVERLAKTLMTGHFFRLAQDRIHEAE